MTKQQSKWNADAEAALMGFTVPVESDEHLRHMIGYITYTLQGMCAYLDSEAKADEIYHNAKEKYNSSKDKSIKYLTVSTMYCGTCLTFVRDKKKLVLKSGKPTNTGVLAWVENLEYPDCSELGYVYFENKNGKIRRCA